MTSTSRLLKKGHDSEPDDLCCSEEYCERLKKYEEKRTRMTQEVLLDLQGKEISDRPIQTLVFQRYFIAKPARLQSSKGLQRSKG